MQTIHKVFMGLNVLGIIIAGIGVFIEPTWARFCMAMFGTFLAGLSIRF